VTVRVRFAPSPTGSLHLGNALTAVANRRFADARGGTLTLRIDDTDAARRLEGGEAALVSDLEWLGIAWDRGPVRQSERGAVHAAAAHVAEREGGAVRDADGSLRLDGVTLVRPDGTATYQLATVADDLEMGITHIIRGSDHRPNEVLQERNKINELLRESIAGSTTIWGLEVQRFEMKDVELPAAMQQVMAMQAEAIREKRARLIKAEAESEASIKLSAAASQMMQNPAALELRRMQMIAEVGAENNSTTVLMIPSDFVSLAQTFNQVLRK